MKVTKKRLLEIINEEMEWMQAPSPHQMGHKQDEEGKMARNQLEHIAKYAMELHQMLEPYGDNLQLEGWVQKKLALAEDYISKVKHYLENELNMSNDLRRQ